MKLKNHLSLTVVFLVSLLFTNCKAQQMTQSTISNTRTINVTGSAEKEVVPDIIVFNINIKEYWKEEFEPGKKYEDYKTKVPMTEIEPRVLAQLKKAGVRDDQIKVSGVGNSYRPSGKELLVSKALVLTLASFETVDLITKTIDPKGVSNLYISELKHSNMEAIQQEVKIAALAAAKKKATYLLESIDEKCGKVLMISEAEYNYNPPVPIGIEKRASIQSDQGGSATELRKITIKYEINATFAIAE